MKKKTPLVSIIIPVFNGSNFMREAIDSALTQSYEKCEVIVVNDGSDDGYMTRSIALSYGDRIRYFEKNNGGVSTALNLGISKMKGDYFSWLSHDDIYKPDKIKKEIEQMDRSDDWISPVYTDWEYLVMPERSIRRSAFSKRYPNSFYQSALKSILFGLIHGCSLLIHKSFFDKYGLFDEANRLTQDYVKWFECFRRGKIQYVSESLVQARIHDRQVGRIRKDFLNECDRLHCWMLECLFREREYYKDTDFYLLYSMLHLRMNNCGFERASITAITCLKRMNQIKEYHKSKIINDMIKYKEEVGIYIFCMGNRGRALVQGLYMRGILVDGFSDSDSRKWDVDICNIHGCTVEDIPLNSYLIVSKEYPDDVMRILVGKGFSHVCSYDEIEFEIMKMPIEKSRLSK